MTSVLGIDAAWTDRNPSGVALVRTNPNQGWECVALAPSYDAFVALAECNPVRWDERPAGGKPEPERLLGAAEQLLGGERVTVVSVDMPLSTAPITERRAADRAISREFGGNGCGTHTPNATRPGVISEELRESLTSLGYRLAVSEPDTCTVIEVYPHPALLCLLQRTWRVPYKVDRSRRYWRGKSISQRADRLIGKFRLIYKGLTCVIQGICDFLPASPYGGSLASLKRYEDALDALVCAWVGTRYLEGCADPFGDQDAAIWVPSSRDKTAPQT